MMPRILVIDDDPAISELVAVNLEMAGYDVSQAPDGIKGQALALQLLPDLIMLDLMLPKVDGFTVCQRLRRDERTADIPVLMLTALGQTQEIARCLAECQEQGLITPAWQSTFRFTHTMIREIAYERLSPWQRMQLHGRLAANDDFGGGLKRKPLGAVTPTYG